MMLTNVNFANALLAKRGPQLLGQLGSHVLSTSVDGYAVDGRVRPAEVDELECVRRVRSPLNDLAEVDDTSLLDEDSLAGQNVDDVGESEPSQGDGLGGEEVVLCAFKGLRGARSEAEGPNAVGVPVAIALAMDLSSSSLGLSGVHCLWHQHLKPRMPNPVTIAVHANPPMHLL